MIDSASDQGYTHRAALVRDFTRAAQPLAIDPNWNRLWAMVWDHAAGATAETVEAWMRYLDDLTNSTAFKPPSSTLAQSLVWNRLAELHRDRIDELEDDESHGIREDVRRQAAAPLRHRRTIAGRSTPLSSK